MKYRIIMKKTNHNGRNEVNGSSRVGTESVAGVITPAAERKFKRPLQGEIVNAGYSQTSAKKSS